MAAAQDRPGGRLPRLPHADKPRPDEKALKRSGADLQNGWLARHGDLVLTEERLVFVPTLLDTALLVMLRDPRNHRQVAATLPGAGGGSAMMPRLEGERVFRVGDREFLGRPRRGGVRAAGRPTRAPRALPRTGRFLTGPGASSP